tara:strand:- start:797 stop:1489 length:693 start_codon:yes stop_codon:yes gene_type:complete
MTRRTSKILRWFPAGLIALLIIWAYSSGWTRYLTFENLQAYKGDFLSYADAHPVLAPALYMGVYTVFVALSLPAAALLTLLGGFLFGKVWGTAFVVLSATLGAVIIFMIAQSSFGVALRERAGPLHKRIADNMQDNAAGYLLFMRLVPLFPFFLVNIVPALFNVPLRTYVWTTFFGIIPGTFVYVNVGQELSEVQQPGDIMTAELLAAFALLGFFALIPTLYKQWKGRTA